MGILPDLSNGPLGGILSDLPDWLAEALGQRQPSQGTPAPGMPIPQANPFRAPPASTAPPMPQPGGTLQGGDRLLGAFQGLANGNGWLGGLANAATTLATGEPTDPANISRNNMMAQYGALIKAGIDPAMARVAIMNPKVMEGLLVPKFEKLAPGEVGGYPTPPGVVAPGARPGGPGLPGPAVGGMRNAVTGGPENPPPNYTWNEPGNPRAGATRIPGTEPPMSSEEAGRLAMVQSAQPGVAEAKKYFLSPEYRKLANLPQAAVTQALNVGEGSRHRRAVELGIEAALRMATGANAPETEVKRYANFYLPGVYETEATSRQKIEGLQRFLDYAQRNMSAGRLVSIGQLPPPDQFMPGPKDQARVPSGIPQGWGVRQIGQ